MAVADVHTQRRDGLGQRRLNARLVDGRLRKLHLPPQLHLYRQQTMF